MKVPKEISSKAEKYEELKKEIDKLYEELEEFANENGFENFSVEDFGISQDHVGEEQPNGEYYDEEMQELDSGIGMHYFPIEGSKRYFWVAYSF